VLGEHVDLVCVCVRCTSMRVACCVGCVRCLCCVFVFSCRCYCCCFLPRFYLFSFKSSAMRAFTRACSSSLVVTSAAEAIALLLVSRVLCCACPVCCAVCCVLCALCCVLCAVVFGLMVGGCAFFSCWLAQSNHHEKTQASQRVYDDLTRLALYHDTSWSVQLVLRQFVDIEVDLGALL
jgi:hypothetical protein